MKIEVNKKFEEFVMNSFFQKNKYSLNDEFNNFDILEIDECYYFSFAAPEGKYSKDFTDRTGNEVSYNRILIEDYINEEDLSQEDLFFQGVIMCLKLIEKIKNIGFDFKIILNINEFPSLTFHKVREGEIYLEDNLNNYIIDSLIVFNVVSEVDSVSG